jgi:hypothetical protein
MQWQPELGAVVIRGTKTEGSARVSSLWSWMFRLLLLTSLAVLCATLQAIWPDSRQVGSMEIASIAALSLATGGVAIWTLSAWIGE